MIGELKNYQKTYRVLFRVIKISIHIKESISLEIVVKKNKQSIPFKDFYPLINGAATVDQTLQFLICKDDPKFEIQINFTFNKMKKQAGIIVMDLHNWCINNSYQQVRSLDKTPGKGSIEFDFIFLEMNSKVTGKSLISLQEYQNDQTKQSRNQIQFQNSVLNQQIKSLNLQKQTLTNRKDLYSKDGLDRYEKNMIEQAAQSQQLYSHEQKMTFSQASLYEQKQKRLYLLNLVQNSGSEQLKLKIAQMGMQLQQSENDS